MARPKTKKAQKTINDSAPLPTAPTESELPRFPLNRMPVELVHMIFSYLTPTQVASIRFMSKMLAAIGLEYIATTVTLTLKEDSFDRLLEIAYHPVINKFVHSLHYEHDFFTDLERTEWERNIKTPEFMAVRKRCSGIPVPTFNASQRAWRAYHRGCGAIKACNTYGKKRLDQAFSTYQNYCAEQDRAWRSDFFSSKLTDALQHLPNLRTIYMPKHGNYSRYQKEIAQLLNGAFYDQPSIESDSVAVTRSLLLAVDEAIHGGQNVNTQAGSAGSEPARKASSRDSRNANYNAPTASNQVSASLGGRTPNGGYLRGNDSEGSNQRVLRVGNFIFGSFNWRLLLEGDKVFVAMKRSISHLTKLGIHLLDDCWIKETRPHFASLSDMEAQRQCLIKGRFPEFMNSAPGLEGLSISTGPNNFCRLMVVVGLCHWPFLKTVRFQGFRVGIHSLEGFCSRHSSTLSNLSLGDLEVDESSSHPGKASSYTVFTTIRETTKLKEASVYGVFDLISQLWNMDDHRDVRRASGTLIGRYLVGEGGDSSLEDYLKEERSRIAEQEGESLVSDIDASHMNVWTSESEDSLSESDGYVGTGARL